MDRRARRNHNAETVLNRLLAVDFYLELDEGLYKVLRAPEKQPTRAAKLVRPPA